MEGAIILSISLVLASLGLLLIDFTVMMQGRNAVPFVAPGAVLLLLVALAIVTLA